MSDPSVSTSRPNVTAGQVVRDALRGERRLQVRASLLLGIWQLMEASAPVLVGFVIDRAIAGGDGGDLLVGLAVLTGLFTALTLGYRFGARAVVGAEAGAAHELRLGTVRRVLDPGGGADRGRTPGALVSVVTDDSNEVSEVHGAVAELVIAAVVVIGATIYLLVISPIVALAVIVGVPALALLLRPTATRIEGRAAEARAAAATSSGTAGDLLVGLRTVKGLGAEQPAGARYRAASRAELAARLRTTNVEVLAEAVSTVGTGVFLVGITWLCASRALDGELSVGQAIAAIGLAQFVIGPINRIAYGLTQAASVKVSGARVADVRSADFAVRSGVAAPDPPPSSGLVLDGLRLASLTGLDLVVDPGEIVGVACSAESDATALVDCLARERDAEAGTMVVAGLTAADVTPEAWRRAVLVSSGESELFEISLERLVADTASGADAVDAALAATTADQVAATLDGGRASVLAERGRSLSGGQRQRVALARALAVESPVLVLDEPTTAIDAATEVAIADGIRRLRADRTTLLVTTSPTLLAVADRIVLVVAGRAAAVGTHAELLAADDRYRELVTG